MFYGSGAGKLPTASAVAGDMVDAARHLGKSHYHRSGIRRSWTLAPVGEDDPSFLCPYEI